MTRRACPVCGLLAQREGQWRYCFDCWNATYPLISRAIQEVAKAVRTGAMPKAKTLTCTDCGGAGHDYDHRDYERPLDVVPVCRSCNLKRGPAKQLSPGYRVLDHGATIAAPHRKVAETFADFNFRTQPYQE